MITFQEKYNLPSKIKLEIQKDESGFIITSPEYSGLITFAEGASELVDVVNDAILTYFEVPRDEAKKSDIVYVPHVHKQNKLRKASRANLSEFVPYSPLYA